MPSSPCILGIGRALVRAAEDWCAERKGFGTFTMQMPLVSAREDLFPYYESQGYVRGETVPFGYPEMLSGEVPIHFVIYQKEVLHTSLLTVSLLYWCYSLMGYCSSGYVFGEIFDLPWALAW